MKNGTKLLSVQTGYTDTIVSIKNKTAQLEMTNDSSKVSFPIAVKDLQLLIRMGHYKVL